MSLKIPSIVTVALSVLSAMLMFDAARADTVKIGLGTYTTEAHPGERLPPATIYTTKNLAGPVPTNKWYSSLLFSQWSQPLFAHPVSYLPDADGFQLGVPEKTVSLNPARQENDIVYPHRAALILTPLAFKMQDARADKISDWSLDIAMGNDQDALTATIVQGSPFSYYQLSRGDISIRTGSATADIAADIFFRSPDHKIIAFTVYGKPYAIYAPNGATWEETGRQSLVLHLPPGASYFSVAALPDQKSETAIEFGKYAYAFVTDTRVAWHYDEKHSRVTSTFTASTKVREGEDHGTLMGLHPHQWYGNPLLPALLPYRYDTVRGTLKLAAGKQFQTRYTYQGILPFWPKLSDAAQSYRLASYMQQDTAGGADAVLGHVGTYWEGKGFGRAVQLMAIAEQQGDRQKRDMLLKAVEARMESWLHPVPNSNKYFYYDRKIGTLIGYPDEYGSAIELNDHHFHYGYWISAAAQIAMRDPAWAAKEKWGGMIDMLIADIATTDRKHAMFPFLRNFDSYEGHSWASGTTPFIDGNNQESSSEAINAWASLILWGEATGNKVLRDTGIYLYTTEIQAVDQYWFDLHHQIFAPEYQNAEVSLIWGNKYVHGTWFTEDPREIHGINLLPITGASLYLGADPGFVKRNIDAADTEFAKYLKSERKEHASPQLWQDILLEYYALHDPQEALARWDDKGLVEEGETRSHTYHWMQSLINMGRPDFDITADTPFYAVFRRGDGRISYLAYNASGRRKQVRFSDGKTLTVPAHGLVRSEATVK